MDFVRALVSTRARCDRRDVTSWLAAANHRRLTLHSRRAWGRDRTPVAVPVSLVHAVREDVTTTACGLPRPAYTVGIWPLRGEGGICPDCRRWTGVGLPTVIELPKDAPR